MKTKIMLGALTYLSLQISVHAAGFNCTLEKLNETEKAICNTPYLNGIDNVTNKLFISALNNTISKEAVQSEQIEWIKERNSCRDNVSCIKDNYLRRNAELSSIQAFQHISDVFPDTLIDAPFENEMKNKNGFTIRDNPWVVKELFNEAQKEKSLNLTQGYWDVLTHMEIKNNLAIIFTVKTKRITYLVLISDITSQSYIIDSYDSESNSAPEIKFIHRDDTSFSYKVSNVYDPVKQKQISAYYKVGIADRVLTEPQKISPPQADNENKTWTGYCGNSSCDSNLQSPDGQWRVASGDDNIKYRNDGVYYFPHDRPDLGVNVFISSVEDTRDDWTFYRNYVWGDKNSFFFDNEGGMACIWKTDIRQKTTERILPIEGLRQPYYIRYNNEDYIISRYTSMDDNDYNMVGFYIAKSKH